MQKPRARVTFYLLLTTLLLAATALRFGHHISKNSFLLFYAGALTLGIIVRCLPRQPLAKKGF
jgi:hypothetical protein